MTRARVAAAIAGTVTALLLQATLVGPVFGSWAVSLPALVVAAVALTDGPAAGMSFGFAAGLAADLGSRHPAGLLALCWLGVGLLCGMVADRRSLRRDALVVGVVCAVSGSVATLLLALIGRGGSVSDAVLGLVPTAIAGSVLALGVVAVVRSMLHTEHLRAPHPVFTDLALGARRG